MGGSEEGEMVGYRFMTRLLTMIALYMTVVVMKCGVTLYVCMCLLTAMHIILKYRI